MGFRLDGRVSSSKRKWLLANSSAASAGLSPPGTRISGAPLGHRPTSMEASFVELIPILLAALVAKCQNLATS